jgi:hypothetical protein
MKRKIPGLSQPPEAAGRSANVYLVQVVKAVYKATRIPELILTFNIIEPSDQLGRKVVSRVDCRAKSFWKLCWFLKDFGYDSALLYDDEIDEKAIVGLKGVIAISNRVKGPQQRCKLHSFAPAHLWQEMGEPFRAPGKHELAS